MAIEKWSTTHLEGQPRTLGTKSANRKLRKDHLLPAVLYGSEMKENINLTVHYVAFEKLFAVNERHIPFILNIDSKEYKVIIKDYKIDPISRCFLHVDFYHVVPKKEFSTLIPIEFIGIPIGVREGGHLLTYIRKVNMKGSIENMPEKISIDISSLQRKKNAIVRDLNIPETCSVLTDKGMVLAEVK